MRALFLLALILAASTALASHFTGTYTDPQSGITLVIQQGTDGRMQGTFHGPNGSFALQGQGSAEGAFGTLGSGQATLGFQGQLSPDGQSLQLALFQMGPDGQPTAQGQPLTLRRGGAAPQAVPPGPTVPGGPAGPGGGTPPGGAAAPPPGTVIVPPTQGAPGPTRPGAGAQPPLGGPPLGNPAAATFGDWNGTYADAAAGLVMVVQGQQGAYRGFIETGGRSYPLRADGDDRVLRGTFEADGTAYAFQAERSGASVVLYTGDARYVLAPAGSGPAPGAAPGNPLGNPSNGTP